jgi:hypothetical protein
LWTYSRYTSQTFYSSIDAALIRRADQTKFLNGSNAAKRAVFTHAHWFIKKGLYDEAAVGKL